MITPRVVDVAASQVLGVVLCAVIDIENLGRDTTLMKKFIRSWSTPHSSAQRPTNVPVLSMVTSNWLTRPGMTSRLNRNSGTQNEWMTSWTRSNRMLRSSGSTSWAGWLGRPVTATGSLAGRCAFRC